MSRPTVALSCIVKDEIRNLPRLLESVSGCFDEIHMTDTGSTDGTIEYLQSPEAEKAAGCKIQLHHFQWINDFAAARNYAIEKIKTDFVMWMDGDDVLDSKDAFIQWRDVAMQFADYWLATYHYALKDDGSPAISFVRERVLATKFNPRFNYFIHEGMKPVAGMQAQYITTWAIKHMRTAEDMVQDRSRNIKIMEARKNQFDGRMWYYYGKELFENNEFEKSLNVLTDACVRDDLEMHDRLLSFQYACYAAQKVSEKMMPEHRGEKLTLAIQLAHQGLQLDPKRAEFHCIIGECYTLLGQVAEALPYFAAAENCLVANSPYAQAIFNYKQCYEELPKIQKAKINFALGRIDEAEKEAKECSEKYKSPEAQAIYDEIQRIRPLIKLDGPKTKVREILITTPPVTAYGFDEEIYKTKGMGGSETACIEMATRLKRLTGLPVKVFNMRDSKIVGESGVEWMPNNDLNEYLSKYEPLVHIAWRHNIKVTNAPTFLWCHDLVTAGCEAAQNFDYMLCLTPFHKNYVKAMQGIPDEKIIITSNGINAEKISAVKRYVKNPNKLVWMSSPDRGLDRAMIVCDEVRKEFPDIELHVYYGLENLYKYGMSELADKLKAMMAQRPWVKYHGFTEQAKMYQDVSDAVIWIHPCNFIETFCITALEMLSLGVFPVTRRLGGLADTLAWAEANHMAKILDHDCVTPEQIRAYADATKEALRSKAWAKIAVNPSDYSWENVAKEWIKFLPIEESLESNAG